MHTHIPTNKQIFLVTGASGFVGRQLCRRLLEDGFSVAGVVRKPTEFPEFAGRAFTQVCVGNIDGQTDWSEALVGVDTVFHLAAEGGLRHEPVDEQLLRLRKVNTAGTTGLARAAVSHGVQRFIYLSSIKANGEQTSLSEPFSETSIPAPITPYGVSKWEAEQELWRVVNGTNTGAVVVRPPLVYGVGVKGNFLQLLNLVSKQIPLPIAGLRNGRSLIYLDNLLDALALCAKHPAATGKTYLVSDGEDVSTGDLIKKIANAMGVHHRLFYFPVLLLRMSASAFGKSEQAGRLLGSLVVETKKISQELNWIPPYSLQQGLQATVDWYKSEKSDMSNSMQYFPD